MLAVPSATLATPLHFSDAWAAGFADGEGCIHIARQTYKPDAGRSTTYRLRFCITQNNREVLEHFLKGLGIHGRIYATRRTAGQNRQAYTLNYDGRHALALVSKLALLLVRERAEANVPCGFGTKDWPGRALGGKAYRRRSSASGSGVIESFSA